MKYLSTGLTALLFFLSSVITLSAQSKDSIEGDFEALMDLYTVTDGPNWHNNSGWRDMTAETMGGGYGITVYPSGHEHSGRVREILLQDNNLTNYLTDSSNNPIPGSDGRYQLIEGYGLRESIGNLKQLEHIVINGNRLTGNIPTSFYTLSNLKVAALGWKNAGSTPIDLITTGYFYPAKDDYIGNKFTGTIPPEISGLVSLERLYLDRNYFDNTELTEAIGDLTQLEHLSLMSNGFIGQIPKSIGNLVNIRFLHLAGGIAESSRGDGINKNETNSFSGQIPSEMGNLITLRSLRLGNNYFSGGIPLSFSNLSSMNEFIVQSANLSGGFPNHINNDNMPGMTSLYIAHNNFSGEIDPEWNGSNINVFNLSYNNITGNLPYSFTDSEHPNFNTKITMFEIQRNNFEGRFADTIEGWYRVRRFNIHGNNFTGPLPASLPVTASMTGDQIAIVSFLENQFSGTIPAGFGKMTSFRSHFIGLSKNNLTDYETGAISPVVLDRNGKYVSGLRGMRGFSVANNDLPQSALDQIIIDAWANVESRLGTEWENWDTGNLSLRNQSTGAIPSNSAAVNNAIQGLRNAGWSVTYDGSDNDDRAVTFPDPPVLQTPQNGADSVEVTPSFVWESSGEGNYIIEVKNEESGQVILTENTDHTSYSLATELVHDETYLWRVKSVDNSGVESEWSSEWSFTTLQHDSNSETGSGELQFPNAPTQHSPADDIENTSLTPTFQWSSVEGADYYILHMSRNSPNGMAIDATTEDTTYTHPEILGDSAVHHWRVRAVKDGELGDWSETWEFMTTGENTNESVTPSENPLTTDLKQNYPNPFNPTTQIEFTLTELQNVSLMVYDLAGRRVATLVEGVKQAGRHSATFDASNLASGVYIYRFISDTNQYTKKMTLLK